VDSTGAVRRWLPGRDAHRAVGWRRPRSARGPGQCDRAAKLACERAGLQCSLLNRITTQSKLTTYEPRDAQAGDPLAWGRGVPARNGEGAGFAGRARMHPCGWRARSGSAARMLVYLAVRRPEPATSGYKSGKIHTVVAPRDGHASIADQQEFPAAYQTIVVHRDVASAMRSGEPGGVGVLRRPQRGSSASTGVPRGRSGRRRPGRVYTSRQAAP